MTEEEGTRKEELYTESANECGARMRCTDVGQEARDELDPWLEEMVHKKKIVEHARCTEAVKIEWVRCEVLLKVGGARERGRCMEVAHESRTTDRGGGVQKYRVDGVLGKEVGQRKQR